MITNDGPQCISEVTGLPACHPTTTHFSPFRAPANDDVNLQTCLLVALNKEKTVCGANAVATIVRRNGLSVQYWKNR
jgi:hypothetical protein